jgi:hypothetical protein
LENRIIKLIFIKKKKIMVQYTVTLNEAQEKALRWVALDPQDWIENFVQTRCQSAIDEIVNNEVQRKLAAGETISVTNEEIVLAANIKSAEERNAEFQPDINDINNPVQPDPFI